LVSEAVGLVLVALVIRPSVTFPDVLAGFFLFGVGIGFASSQLTNVVLSDIDPGKSGVASGANATLRQVGSGLGVAIIGSILTAQTVRHGGLPVRALAHGTRAALLVAASFVVVGAVVSFLIPRVDPPGPGQPAAVPSGADVVEVFGPG
jgi:predicted MFS family arabinose efflux permease